MDAEALFPSLDLKDILDGVWDLIINTDVPFGNIDIKEMLKYIAIMYTDDELRKHNLISVVPVRQTVIDGTDRGSPTIAFLDSDIYTRVKHGVKELGVPKWSWKGIKLPSILQKKWVIALTVMKAMETILTNHV